MRPDGDDPPLPWPEDLAELATPGSERWHEALDAHCERLLGPCPSALGEIVPTGPFTVTLYPHLPSHDRPWLTLRTAGVSDYPMTVPRGHEDQRYCELLTYLPPDWQLEDSELTWWPGRMLRQLGQFVHESSTWFGQGHTVLVSEPGETYAPGTLVSAALLRAPEVEDEDFDELAIEGTSYHFLWAFPITEAETNLKLEHGTRALLRLIEEQELSHVLDPGRACLVTGRRP
jgi:hypothetical protein